VTAKPSRSGLVVFVTSRLASLGLVLVIGFLLLTSFVVTMAVGALLRFAEEWVPVPALVVAATDASLSLLVAAGLFAMIFKILPDVRLQWRASRSIPGAVVARCATARARPPLK
jgi:membrane protein